MIVDNEYRIQNDVVHNVENRMMEYNTAVMSILKDTIERGFFDYEDYKDQLEAVDMNVFSGETYIAAMELYFLLGEKEGGEE